MDKKEIKLTTEKGLILEGSLPEFKYKDSDALHGDIASVYEFLKKRVGTMCSTPVISNAGFSFSGRMITYNIEQSDVQVDYQKGIVFVSLTHDSNRGKDTFVGKLEPNPIWDELAVNKEKSWPISDIRRKLKYLRQYFANPEKHTDLMSDLNNFSVKIESLTEDKAVSGQRRNVREKKMSDTKWESMYFDLETRVFHSGAKNIIRVEIYFDVSDGDARVTLISPDLMSLMETIKEAEIAECAGKISKEFPELLIYS
jgi:hypothetical protein